jgi:6-phosphogluconolactonase (cycloisomerase 2 family)
MAYVGTFSSPLKDVLPTQVDLPPGNGGGIHLFQVDRQTGELRESGLVRMGNSPSCLVVNRSATLLFSANETDRTGPDRHGTVSSFRVDPANGALTPIHTVSSGGAGPTYVSLHPTERFLLVANYFGGSVSVVPIDAEGRLSPPSDVHQDEGPIGPTRAASAPPGSFAISGHDRTHAHMIESDPAGQFVLHVDLALDQIFVWKFDTLAGRLLPTHPGSVSLHAGDGPRHFDFHPNGRWLYSIQEEGSTVAQFDYDPAMGGLMHRQSWSTLPPGYAGSNFCSEILVSPDGAFLYAGNRLHDSIAVFSIGKDGSLTYRGEEWTRGDYPRSFQFDPRGEFLYCCNQRADHVTVFRVNKETGGLTFTGQYVPVGNPSIICFADLRPKGSNP